VELAYDAEANGVFDLGVSEIHEWAGPPRAVLGPLPEVRGYWKPRRASTDCRLCRRNMLATYAKIVVYEN